MLRTNGLADSGKILGPLKTHILKSLMPFMHLDCITLPGLGGLDSNQLIWCLHGVVSSHSLSIDPFPSIVALMLHLVFPI